LATLAYFVSDTHFGFHEYPVEKPLIQKFEYLCNLVTSTKGELYILGDLFDYWFEYKTVIQKNSYRILSCLEHMVENKIDVYYVIGNHDFSHRDLFEKQLGIKIFEKFISKEINSKKFFLAHGDGLLDNDKGYLILKSIVRNKKLQSLYSKLHPNIGISLAKYFSKVSRNHTANRDYGPIDFMLKFSTQKIKEGYDYVVLGHSHRVVNEKINRGFYINLGTWLIKPTYGIFNGEKFEIIEF